MRRWRTSTAKSIAFGVLLSCCVSSAAIASQPERFQTLTGHGAWSPTADAFEVATLGVDIRFSKKVAEGTLSTTHKSSSSAWDGFRGEVSCVIDRGSRIVIGAFGSSYHAHEEFNEHTNQMEVLEEPYAGRYMQVAILEFGSFPAGLNGEAYVRRAWNDLGAFGGGEPASSPPSCTGWNALKAYEPDEEGVLLLSPVITSPREGAEIKSTSVTLEGRGEPYSTLNLYQGNHRDEAVPVAVTSKGKWSYTLGDLSIGAHEVTVESEGDFASAVRAHIIFTAS